jgi:hypothetical protein
VNAGAGRRFQQPCPGWGGSLILLPLAIWFFDESNRDHGRSLTAVLDTVALERKMVPLKDD